MLYEKVAVAAACVCGMIFFTGCAMDENIKKTSNGNNNGIRSFSIDNATGLKELDQAVADLSLVLRRHGLKEKTACDDIDHCITYKLVLTEKDDPLSLSRVGIIRSGLVLSFYGSSASALRHLIYSYLKERFHSQWYMPGKYGFTVTGTRNDPFFFNQSKVKYTLPFLLSYQYWGESPKWHGRMREIRDRNIKVHHNWHKMIPPDEYFESHPEYYALIDGERRPYQLCTSNPAVIDLMSRKALDYFALNPEAEVFSVSPDDGYNFCQCENCRELDKETGSITDRLMVFFNAVAKRLVAVHPDKKIAFYAYLNYTDPPVSIKPHKAIIPVICHTPWEFCHNHSIVDPDCPANQRFRKICRRWCKLSDEVYIREYYGHFLWYGLWPILHSVESDVEFFKQIGIKGIISESHEHWGIAGWVLHGAGCYMAGERMSWQNYVMTYCNELFPHSAHIMHEYITFLEAGSRSVGCRRMDALLTDESMAHLYLLSDKLLARAVNERAKALARLNRYGLDLTFQLIQICKARSAGDIETMISNTKNVLEFIETLKNMTDIPPVIKYPLATDIMSRFYSRYQNEKLVAQKFFSESFGFVPEKLNQGIPIRRWMMSDPYPNTIKPTDAVPMYPPVLDSSLVAGLETQFPPEQDGVSVKWSAVRYDDSYYSLYQYFPHRPENIRYYRAKFHLKKLFYGCVAVRAIDGYVLMIDGKEIGSSKIRRFERKGMFDWYVLNISEGSHDLMIKLEGSGDLEKDDFTVMFFDHRGEAVEMK